MIGIIVTGHGNFATGLASSLKLIAGDVESFIPIDFTGNSIDELAGKMKDAIATLDTKEILIFSDLAGGSPFKTAVEVKMGYEDKTIEVLAGTNLPMIIEISMARAFVEDVVSLADMAVNTGKDQVMKYVFTKREEVVAEDGI